MLSLRSFALKYISLGTSPKLRTVCNRGLRDTYIIANATEQWNLTLQLRFEVESLTRGSVLSIGVLKEAEVRVIVS